MGRARPAIVVSLAAIFLSLPVLFFGFPILAHDGPVHLLYCREFGAQFWSGELYPRWLMATHSGFGSPAFFVYAPLPYWITSLLAPGHPPGRIALSASAVVALWGSGIAAWLWLRRMADETAAVVGAVVYMASAYHLTVDLYMRAAFAEFWAFVWMPAILYFADGVIARRRRAIAGLAAAYGLLVMTHLLTTLMFSPVPLAYALYFAKPGERLRTLSTIGGGMLLGCGMAAIYLFPALEHRPHLSSAKYLLHPVYSWWNNFPPLDARLFEVQGEWPGFVQFLSLVILLSGLALICFAAIARSAAARFWLAIGGAGLFMTLPVSATVWRLIPVLAQLQLPWRFLAIVTLALAALSTLALRVPSRIAAAGLGVVALLWLSFFGVMAYRISRQDLASAWARDFSMDPFLSDWTDVATANKSMPQVTVESGGSRATVTKWAPRDIRVQVHSQRESTLLFHQFYYPGWKSSAPVEASDLNFIRVKAPAGDYELRLQLDGGRWESIGRWVSALSLALIAAVSGWPARLKHSPA